VSGPESAAPRIVSRFEANLLRILHFFLRREPAASAEPLIFSRRPRPRCLSRTAARLVEEALAKGCVSLLARASGWRRERHLRAGRVAEGRLWERTPPEELALSFSGHALGFLLWITAEDPAEQKGRWRLPPVEQMTFGDQLLAYYAFDALGRTEAGQALPPPSALAGHALCRLAYPEVAFGPDAEGAPDFLPWTAGVGACILEVLQGELAARWLDVERRKPTLTDWRRMLAVGRRQDQVLDAFLGAVHRAGRLDLARFLLRVLANLLLPDREAQARDWTGGLQGGGPRLADRAETNRAALVLLRQADRFWRWEQEARGVAFFDENYAASQLWKGDWERWHGEALHRRAQAVLHEVEPLQA
jgi:hypothetical protein